MCENIEYYNLIKDITNIAAPLITIFSALLGLFTETKIENTKYVKGKKVIYEKLSIWAWISMAGILLGGIVSIWSVNNDKKINEIQDCKQLEESTKLQRKKDIQDSTYNSKTDKILILSDTLQNRINRSSKIIKNIMHKSDSTLDKMDKSYSRQESMIYKQEDLNNKNAILLDQNQQMMHPLFPLQIRIIFEIDLSEIESTYLQKCADSLFPLNNKKVPKYLKKDFEGFYFSLHELPDMNTDYDKVFLNLHEFLERRILPEYVIKFFPTNIDTKNYEEFRDKGFEIKGQSPYTQDDDYKTAKNYKLRYNVNLKSKFIRGEIILNEPSKNSIWGARIKSLYSIPDGCVVLEPYFSFSDSSVRLESISFNCGYNYYESYWVTFKRDNIFNNEKYYYFKVKDLNNFNQ